MLPRLGGCSDAVALCSLGAAVAATTPFVGVDPHHAAALAMAGTTWLGYRVLEKVSFSKAAFDSNVAISSSAKTPDLAGGAGMLIGYKVEDGRPVYVPDEDLMRHLFILGQSGVGKTVLGANLIFQQIARGGGLTFIDGKMTDEELQKIWQMCAWCGRERDLFIINPGRPEMSNTYNPLLYGDPDEIADRPISTIPQNDSNPGTDYYRKAAHQGIVTLVSAMKKAGLAYNFIDFAVMLMNSKALEELERKLMEVAPNSDEARAFSLFVDQFRYSAKPGADATIDMKRLKEVFGGIGQRMYLLGTGKFGEVLNSYTPDLNLFEAIMNNKIIYVQLPTMGKNEAAMNFAKMFISDFRTSISWLQDLPEENKLQIPHFFFMDEAGGYVSMNMTRPFEQARSARVILCPAAQTMANFKAISEEFAEMVIGNTWTKLIFKVGTQASAEEMAEVAGMHIVNVRQVAEARNKGTSSQILRLDPAASESEGLSETVTYKEQEENRVSADQLKALGKGECVMLYGGDQVHHLKIPMLKFDSQEAKKFGKPRVHRFRKRAVKGADFFKNAEKYLSRKMS